MIAMASTTPATAPPIMGPCTGTGLRPGPAVGVLIGSEDVDKAVVLEDVVEAAIVVTSINVNCAQHIIE
jgi:hypothetical protein